MLFTAKSQSTPRLKIIAAATATIFALSGCMPTTIAPPQQGAAAQVGTRPQTDEKKVQSYLADKPAETHKFYSKVVTEGERNRVLNLLRAGLVSMELGHSSLAARSFDEALVTIETIYAGDKKAEQARSNFTAEDRKIFRGEPYERAMAFYYRGVLYLMEGDYENARASFKSGILQDTLAEREKYRGDFALLDFLAGWASQCNGNVDIATDAYALAKKHNSEVVLPKSAHNLVVLSDQGYVPSKYSTGKHKSVLRISAKARSYTPDRAFRLNGSEQSLTNWEHILWQARTRGGREFDAILAGKAQFKEELEQASDAAGVAFELSKSAPGDIGLVAAAASGLFSIVASTAAGAVKAQADTRFWNNLPESVFYGTYRVDTGTDGDGLDVGGLPGGRFHLGGDERCRVVWTRDPATPL